MRPLMQSAANGCFEPFLTDAAVYTDDRNTNQSRHWKAL